MKKLVLVLVGILFAVLLVVSCTPGYDPPRKLVLEEIEGITVGCVNTTDGYECSLLNVSDYGNYRPAEKLELDKKIFEIDETLKLRCEEDGGKFKCYGFCSPIYERFCDLPYEDAGEACSDNSECEGLCLANDRECESNCAGTCATYRLSGCDNPYELRNGVIYFESVECD